MNRLTAAERECIIGATDADDTWRIYVDTPSRFARKLLIIARRWNVTPRPPGCGVEFELPFRAVGLVGSPSARRLAASRAALQEARNGPETGPVGAVAEGPGLQG